ncbi:uncharacterized protein BDR25DRAFT_339432 [Lindgomyces ingoldianus]|uniref:Uncharacterized protein n=1 Tax=Lindgomyces ingoldianus TaxID=673940 RepID=A0ACB6RDM6_9PLEO|nr:uncharacterized protein BDR25DRAFT_339432 [Lindgomyces ingoldianus]KAF2476420.1 hypothetical protein BDR25DRAFT_339432 [Lindgomyces ingoldianus]
MEDVEPHPVPASGYNSEGDNLSEDSLCPPNRKDLYNSHNGYKDKPGQKSLQDGIEDALNSVVEQEGIRLQTAINRILECMHELNTKIEEFRDYVATQDSDNTPLYQWNKYEEFPRIAQATHKLGTAIKVLKIMFDRVPGALAPEIPIATKANNFPLPVFPEDYATACKDEALQCSISISNGAAYVMEVVNQTTAKCIDELELSSLSQGARKAATEEMSRELAKIMKYSTGATEQVYLAKDLLIKAFESCTTIRQAPMQRDSTDTLKSTKQDMVRKEWVGGLQKGGAYIIHGLAVIGVLLLTLLVTAPLKPNIVTRGDLKKVDNRMDLMMFSIMTYVFEENSAMKARLAGLEKLSQVQTNRSEAIQLRLDNLWDSLGIPDENGMYRFDKESNRLSEFLEHQLIDLKGELLKQAKTLNDMRRQNHLMDIRLTRQIQRLQPRESKWGWWKTEDADRKSEVDEGTWENDREENETRDL